MCASAVGQMAVELQKKAAEETASLKPAHTYVPWVTVNGIAIGGAFEQLQTFICASYLGERYFQPLCYISCAPVLVLVLFVFFSTVDKIDRHTCTPYTKNASLWGNVSVCLSNCTSSFFD